MMYDIKIAYGEKGLCDDSFDTTKIKLLDRIFAIISYLSY